MSAQPLVTPPNVVQGLGTASREVLAVYISLFEDTTLARRLDALFSKSLKKIEGWQGRADRAPSEGETLSSLRRRADSWKDSDRSDDDLRLTLWIYLREAFALDPIACTSTRSASESCDDLVAAALHSLEPSFAKKLWSQVRSADLSDRPATLDALAQKTLGELMEKILRGDTPEERAARDEIMADVRTRLDALDEDDRQRLLREIGSDDLNDAAIQKILITGGGLTVLSASVSLAGFSAYILAAQLSAYVPLITGPGLVSFLAVLSNPITVVVATGGMVWRAATSANRQIRQAVAVRVISLLGLGGVSAGQPGIDAMLCAFRRLPDLHVFGDLQRDALQRYQQEWRSIERSSNSPNTLDADIASMMARPANAGASRDEQQGELENAAALAVMTLGDVLYCAYAIDPTVMQAAGFARATDLSDPIDFAAFAHTIEAMNPAGRIGAISDVKGYVAERVVAAQLIANGHHVVFPAASNEAGWDIDVDGVKVQIKDTVDLSYIAKHFEHYGYQYPLIANAEVADLLAAHNPETLPEWAHHVYFVEGYSNGLVEHMTDRSIEAGDGMTHPHVPTFALILSAYRNFLRLQRREITAEQAYQQVLLDGATRMSLAAIGGFAGKGIGLLIFGPAGALVLGVVVPVASQMQSKSVQSRLDAIVTSKIYKDWKIDMQLAIDALVMKVSSSLTTKANVIKQRLDALEDGAAAIYLRWRLNDDLCFLREAWCRLDLLTNERERSIEMMFSKLLVWTGTSTIHPAVFQEELAASSRVFARRPRMTDRLMEHVKTGSNAARKFGSDLSEWLKRRDSEK
jgi:hypothetical protein